MFYKVCDQCGATLDPDERCDCRDKEKTAPDAANIQSGKGESDWTAFTSKFIKIKGGNQA